MQFYLIYYFIVSNNKLGKNIIVWNSIQIIQSVERKHVIRMKPENVHVCWSTFLWKAEENWSFQTLFIRTAHFD